MNLLEGDSGILFVEDSQSELCSFKAIKKVHEINRHKGKDPLISAYRNAGWKSPDVVNTIDRVVNDCQVCQKFKRSITRPRVTHPKPTSFNEIVMLDLKDFGSKYILWMVDSFTRFIKVNFIGNKKADIVISAIMDTWCMSVGFPTTGFFVDNGGEFVNIKLDELMRKLSLTVKFGPAFSP